ncbi:transcription repressor NadR [Carnobacterium funditum]|uniref:transcription repressor NadR n=1 Tax=Carnobacterium funditum TaxID=2752 RepID=UPI00054E4203|nr:transcription repressor NadR [Carnobacterium funditum]
MEPSTRRNNIVGTLKKNRTPISASVLAKKLKVSRQIIVGDIALIRATGIDITATPKGYVLNIEESQDERYIRKIACTHKADETQKELYAIVDNGGELIDVIVEHPVYGELKGQLNIGSRHDADQFLRKINKSQANLLSELTQGVHLHTIACKDKEIFDRIIQQLSVENLLYQD